ncbi:unnamed protein product, partial [Meganyctiphanes norvegica]
ATRTMKTCLYFLLVALSISNTYGGGICTDGYFMCATGVCIPAEFVCDGVVDCTTADDEKSCSKSGAGICTDGYFMCADSTCIPEDFVCDGVADCANTGDDEKNCAKSG